MNQSILEQPFEGQLVKTRKGAFGKTLSYVEGAEYIRRLNVAFEGEWSFEVIEHHVYDAEVVVVGKLTAAGITKTAFGGSSVTTNTQTGEIISIADDLKAAATDALKKAASLLGVGLHLYSEPVNNVVPGVPTVPNKRSNGNGRGNGKNGDDGADGDGRVQRQDRLTQRQLAAIWSIGRALNVKANEVRRRSVEIYGAVPEQLSKTDASALISQMQSALPGNGSSVRP